MLPDVDKDYISSADFPTIFLLDIQVTLDSRIYGKLGFGREPLESLRPFSTTLAHAFKILFTFRQSTCPLLVDLQYNPT